MIALLSVALHIWSDSAGAIPRFARTYGVSCQTCHVAPPMLNTAGQEFIARGYRFSESMDNRSSTVPVSIWISTLAQRQPGRNFARGFPNRIEFIASDAVTSRVSYFVEWRALSMELRGDGTLRDRSGRFEDAFVVVEPIDNVGIVAGQFRMLSQVDVSQRMSISEPLVFSSGLVGERASTSRLTGLRSFSPSGRAPALRAQVRSGLFDSRRHADGWFTVLNLPMTGELSLPLTNEARTEASFEFEAVPKGVFVESFVRRGLTSLGGHVFAGSNERLLAQFVGTVNVGRFFGTAAVGTGKTRLRKFSNRMVQGELEASDWAMVASRVEHQTGSGGKPAYIPYAVVHFPGTTYTLRLALERRIQKGNNQVLVETSLIF